MTTKELIREKIDSFYAEYKAKFHQNGEPYNLGIIDGLDMAERILDTLPDESEQPTRGYDEAYLNEKIAKASKSWEGVDVDKFMDEIRGREPVTDCHDLREAAEKSARQYYVDGGYSPFPNTETAAHIAGFKAGAEWGADHLRDTTKKISEDLALTIADIEKLHTFLYAVKNNKQGAFTFTRLSDEQYEEVLRRFNKTKEQ